jgi:hypothetical protein
MDDVAQKKEADETKRKQAPCETKTSSWSPQSLFVSVLAEVDASHAKASFRDGFPDVVPPRKQLAGRKHIPGKLDDESD